MRNKFLVIIFVFMTSCVEAATIYVNVDNVNGVSVSGAYVKLYNDNWSLIKTGYTNSSGMATFALLDYGTYHYEVYYTGEVQEFWGSKENISLQSPTLTSNFTRYWPYRYSYNKPSTNVYAGNQVTFEISIKNQVSISRNVKVEIWVDKSKSGSWDFNQISSVQSISSNGSKKFTFNYIPSSTGTYYWKMNVLTYNDSAGSYIITDSYSWSTAFIAENQESDLDIYVKNVNGNYIENAYVKLFDNNWNFVDDDYTNSSGRADFNNLKYGTYHYEVFSTGDVQEFWGGVENLIINSASESETFTRNWPYRSSFNTSVNNSAIYDVTIKNNLNFSRNVKVELWVDKKKSNSGDFHQLSSSQSVNSDGTKKFTFNFYPTTSGTYYYKMHVLTYNDKAKDYLVTDSYSWTESFSITIDTPFPITNGILIYHSYSDYFSRDSRLYSYNFSNGIKNEISSGWNIDHEMNAVPSPDGSKIVFMGYDAGSSDWDIYIWDLNSPNAPRNLTSGNNLTDEDPKFSPDGTKIVFKQNKDIKIMNLNTGTIESVTNDGSAIEESMPMFNSTGSKIVYARGANETSDIYIINIDGNSASPLYNATNINEYFPVYKDNNSFYYTRWVSSSNPNDQLYVGDYYGNSERLSINKTSTDNYSDAGPVNSDLLFFSSTKCGGMGDWDLYLGRISTSEIWSLNNFRINSSLKELGACYIQNQSFNISASTNPSNGGHVSGAGSYSSGMPVILTATAESGYDFVNWTENENQISVNPNYSFTVNFNRTLVANFKAKTYNISTSTNPSNGGHVSGAGSYSSGATANLIATAESGYDFVNWTENENQVSANPNYSFTVTSNRTLVANFKAKTYNISASTNPSNGGHVSGAGSYSSGATANLIASAESGFDFVNWTENGNQVSANPNYSFTVTSNRTLVANFSNMEYMIKATVNPSNSGTINGHGGYNTGDVCNLIATAVTGYDFINWTENGNLVSANPNYSFTVTSNRTLVANFKAKTYNISASTNPNNGGHVSGAGSYSSGATANLIASAESGYDFVNWTENGNLVSANPNYSFTVTSNRTLVANFSIKECIIKATVNPSNSGTINGHGGYSYGYFCNLIATAVTGYDFVNWTENGNQVSANPNYGFTVTSNRTLVANFSNKEYIITASVNPNNSGTIKGHGGYNNGDVCNLIATAITGYDFINWTENGDLVSTNPNYCFTVSSSRSLVANFKANTYNISASVYPSNSGNVSGAGSYSNEATANLTATAESGYDFVNWTENGNLVSTNPNYRFTVTCNRTLVANFKVKTYDISASVYPSNGGSVSGAGSYSSGATANLTATAESEYDYVNWTENGNQVTANPNYSFTVTCNRTLVANFKAKTYNISASTNPSNGGHVSGAGSYSSGATANLIATAESGYDFVNWTENGNQVSANPNYSFTVTSNRTLVANFRNNIHDQKPMNLKKAYDPSKKTLNLVSLASGIFNIDIDIYELVNGKKASFDPVPYELNGKGSSKEYDLSSLSKGIYDIRIKSTKTGELDRIILRIK